MIRTKMSELVHGGLPFQGGTSLPDHSEGVALGYDGAGRWPASSLPDYQHSTINPHRGPGASRSGQNQAKIKPILNQFNPKNESAKMGAALCRFEITGISLRLGTTAQQRGPTRLVYDSNAH